MSYLCHNLSHHGGCHKIKHFTCEGDFFMQKTYFEPSNIFHKFRIPMYKTFFDYYSLTSSENVLYPDLEKSFLQSKCFILLYPP